MRLTNKDITYITSGANVIEIPDIIEGHKYTGQVVIKCGQLEDLMEKYNIKTLEQVESAFIGFVSDYTEEGRNHVEELLKLEEELGIDLITLFKAYRYGIYVKWDNEKTSSYDEIKEFYKTVEGKLAFITEYKLTAIKIEEYGKHWALTKEELKDE